MKKNTKRKQISTDTFILKINVLFINYTLDVLFKHKFYFYVILISIFD